MIQKKIAFLDVVHPLLEAGLKNFGWETHHFYEESANALSDLIQDFHGIVVRSRLPINENLLQNCNQIEFIARSGAGMENIDVEYCNQKKIALFNAPEGNRNAVGEHALGMLLSLLNQLHLADKEVRNGKWNREANRGYELDGKTIGIIGFGNNGSAFAQKLRGFDVKILAFDKYKKNYAPEWVKETNMSEIFDCADVVSFHIPQNEETLYMANDTFFNQFEKPITIINLARGKIVKTEALVKAMKSGKVNGACLDVLEYEKSSFENMFDQEIPEDLKYILESKKTILTPHVGGWTFESYQKLSQVLLDKIKNHYKM